MGGGGGGKQAPGEKASCAVCSQTENEWLGGCAASAERPTSTDPILPEANFIEVRNAELLIKSAISTLY